MDLSWLWMALGDLVSPRTCAACDERTASRALLCRACASSVVRFSGSDDPVAFGLYGGALASALLRLKYGGRPDLAIPLGLLLAQSVGASVRPSDVHVVVPVPVPYDRLVERGYNQAALLAQVIARRNHWALAPRVLARRTGGCKQAALGRHERLLNLQGAFSIRHAKLVERRRVFLIDDVSTTGATIATCRETLLAAGALEVRAAVVARTEAP